VICTRNQAKYLFVPERLVVFEAKLD